MAKRTTRRSTCPDCGAKHYAPYGEKRCPSCWRTWWEQWSAGTIDGIKLVGAGSD